MLGCVSTILGLFPCELINLFSCVNHSALLILRAFSDDEDISNDFAVLFAVLCTKDLCEMGLRTKFIGSTHSNDLNRFSIDVCVCANFNPHIVLPIRTV